MLTKTEIFLTEIIRAQSRSNCATEKCIQADFTRITYSLNY